MIRSLVCLKPDARSRFFYRIRVHRGRKDERRRLSEADYAGLVTAAHHQLHAPLILCWEMSLPQCELRRSSLAWLSGSLSWEVPIGMPSSVQRRRLW